MMKCFDQVMAVGLIAIILQLLAVVTVVVGLKECTNTPTQLSSHTARYKLSNSKNKTWVEEVYAQGFYHLNPPSMLPRKMLLQIQSQLHLPGQNHHHGHHHHQHHHHHQFEVQNEIASKLLEEEEVPGTNFLREVSLHDVRLHEDSIQGQAQQTNLEYLLLLDVDRLLWSFRKTAGLPTPSTPYGGWESPQQELRGHFVGHYLSATAKMWASTHNQTLNDKMSAIVDELDKCQKQIGTGYLSAFPSEFFDRLEAIKPVWAPYYTIHKILAGLVDQYTFAGNTKALDLATRMVDYFYNRVQNVILLYSMERHWESLNEEFGGMNDILYRLFSITGDKKHLILAHLFDKPCFLGMLAVKADSISGFHTNTHLPVVIGSQMRYEVTSDPLYKDIAMFFMDIVNSSHSYATGGTSYGEFWEDPKRLADTLKTENEESCTTYNVLKISRALFRWTKTTTYADHYERAILNGVLGIQRGTDPGVMIYMLPLGHGVSKANSYHGWGTQFDSFWCCYGTGIESFSKLGDSIYFEDGSSPNLYIIQFISSSIDWKSGQIMVNQSVDPVVSWDPFLRLTITITSKENVNIPESTLSLRIPSWTQSENAVATLNGENLPSPSPGNFLSVKRTWKSGDKLTLQLPMPVWTENIKDDRNEYNSIQAILFGPYVLAGHSDGNWSITTGPAKSLSDWISPVPPAYNYQLVSLSQVRNGQFLLLTRSKNNTFSMATPPADPGSNSSVHVTYRFVFRNSSTLISSREDIIGQKVMIELFDQPGTFVAEQGLSKTLKVSKQSSAVSNWDDESAIFQIHDGFAGNGDAISLESMSHKGCFIASSGDHDSQGRLDMEEDKGVKLMCKTGKHFNPKALSFTIFRGLQEYNPMSFVAKGKERNFLLQPLMSFQDEYYNVYFDIHQ